MTEDTAVIDAIGSHPPEETQVMDDTTSAKASKTLAVLATLLLLALFCVSDRPEFSSDHKRNSLGKHFISTYNTHRSLSLRGPETTETKVPKLFHFIWTGSVPPEHVKRVIQFTIKKAREQGFEVRDWNDQRANTLIHDQYPWLIDTWKKLQAIPLGTTGRGTRLADFLRLVVVHAFGGVYMDADAIPCHGLDELIAPGKASFPWPFLGSTHPRINNAFFSAPPGHPVLQIALEKMAANDHIDTDQILDATGPVLLARATREHFKRLGKGWFDSNPGGDGMWYERPQTDVRFGVFENVRHIFPMHLGYSTWFGGGSQKGPKWSPCEERLDLIEPFLEVHCNAPNVNSVLWQNCGLEASATPK